MLKTLSTGALERRFIHFAHTFAVDVVIYDYIGSPPSFPFTRTRTMRNIAPNPPVYISHLPSFPAILFLTSLRFPPRSYGLSSGDAPDERLCELSVEAV